ncbi:MAG: hypothetical protein AB7E52_01120 [Bdellovibrionales bacterium]
MVNLIPALHAPPAHRGADYYRPLFSFDLKTSPYKGIFRQQAHERGQQPISMTSVGVPQLERNSLSIGFVGKANKNGLPGPNPEAAPDETTSGYGGPAAGPGAGAAKASVALTSAPQPSPGRAPAKKKGVRAAKAASGVLRWMSQNAKHALTPTPRPVRPDSFTSSSSWKNLDNDT